MPQAAHVGLGSGGWRRRVGRLALVAALGCGSSEPTPPPGPATVTVRAVSDTVGVVGSTLQLTAEARNAQGGIVPGAAFTWISSAPGTATVNGSGLVSFLVAGPVVITAMSGTVSSTIGMRGIVVDIGAIQWLFSDVYATSLVAALSTGTRAAVTTATDGCSSALAGGALSKVRDCLAALLAVSAPAEPTDTALLAVLALFWAHAQRLLHFAT